MLFSNTPKPGTVADRRAGVVLGGAVGDALGVPYEFARTLGPDDEPVMRGGGLGSYEPGEWSDDTQMACCILEAVADGCDLTTNATLKRIANRFLEWMDSPPADVGVQTQTVLRMARVDRVRLGGALIPVENFRTYARDYVANHPRAAGNGALMRTGPVALASLDDRNHTAHAARLIAELTHADPLAGDSCVLWSEAIRIAITEQRFAIHEGLDLIPTDRRLKWQVWLAEATTRQAHSGPIPGAQFTPNGYTVTALQAATAAITGTPQDDPATHFTDAVTNTVRIGNDTDTTAAIAGSLLGARWGATAIPRHWTKAIHGWPGYDARTLTRLATR